MGFLNALLFNARSIRNKFQEFVAVLTLEKPDIVAVTESWVHTLGRDFEGEFHVPGYLMYHRDRSDREGGGVMLYIKESLKVCNTITSPNYEVLGVDLVIGQVIYRVLLVYKPPHQPIEGERQLYQEIEALLQGRICILMGDFNSNVDWETRESPLAGTPLLEFVSDNFLSQWVKEPTRGENILDLVLTTEDDIVSDLRVGEELGSSDHKMIRFVLKVPDAAAGVDRPVKLDFQRADFSGFRYALSGLKVDEATDVESSWSHFRDNFMQKQATFVPLKSVRGTSRKPKWLSRELERDIKRKRTVYQQAKATGNFGEYNQLKRSIKTRIRSAKRNEEIRVARICKKNSKEFFSYVNSRKPISKRIGPLESDNGTLYSSDKENATLLNEYFSSVFTVENDLYDPEPGVVHQGNSINSIRCTVEEVSKKIDNLDSYKAPGTDRFLPRVLKEVRDEISPQLVTLFNRSLETGVVPQDWREANVTPLFKKGATSKPGNYRPVSLTSVVGKLLESIIVDKLTDHLEGNNLLKNSQHGFRRHRSCLTNLLEFFHEVFTEHDRCKAVDVIYMDFQKAFDKVPFRRLMLKVRALGVEGEISRWIENWLSERRQRVVINSEASGWTSVTSGVPQGSVLGPLLFIIYINDIDEGIVSRISKFADDTKLGSDVSTPEKVEQLQLDLEKLGEWSDKWQMPFNATKCKVMHIGYRNPHSEYILQGKALESTDSEKDLGVVITNDLKFSKQCIAVEKKAQKLLGYIKRQFGYRNKEIVLSLYNSLVRPQLEYAVQFWSPSYRKDITRLERVQARATKLIPELRHMCYADRLKELNLFSLETRRLRGQLIEVFKILRGFENVDYRSMFELSEGRTRNNGYKLELKRYNRDLCGNFFSYKICSRWNALPSEVVNSDSVEQFKTRLDKVLPGL